MTVNVRRYGMLRVLNVTASAKERTNALYVGRPSPYGNPYKMATEADRERVCDLFDAYALAHLVKEPSWLDPLRGYDLICHCAPRRCHAHALLRLANMPTNPEIAAAMPVRWCAVCKRDVPIVQEHFDTWFDFGYAGTEEPEAIFGPDSTVGLLCGHQYQVRDMERLKERPDLLIDFPELAHCPVPKAGPRSMAEWSRP